VHDRDNVELYLTETFTFRVLEDKAAIFLRRGTPKAAALAPREPIARPLRKKR